jgi:hypothetical protein
MPAYNLVINHDTGTTMAVGKDGRRHEMPAIAAAEQAAAAGDLEAAALLQSIDFGVDDDGAPLSRDEIRALAEQVNHDCPECRAACARGEQPITLAQLDLEAMRRALPPAVVAEIDAALAELDAGRSPVAWCGPPGELDAPPIAWRASDLLSFGPGPQRRRSDRRRARARARARRLQA